MGLDCAQVVEEVMPDFDLGLREKLKQLKHGDIPRKEG